MLRTRATYGAIKQNPDAIDAFYRAVCRDIVASRRATRASVWNLSPAHDVLTNLCQFDSRDGTFTSGTVLNAAECPAYFQAINHDLRVVANDVLTHPATASLDRSVFVAIDVRSLLVAVVLIEGEPGMLLCCAQCGTTREWTEEDLSYLRQLASVVSMGVKNSQEPKRSVTGRTRRR